MAFSNRIHELGFHGLKPSSMLLLAAISTAFSIHFKHLFVNSLDSS